MPQNAAGRHHAPQLPLARNHGDIGPKYVGMTLEMDPYRSFEVCVDVAERSFTALERALQHARDKEVAVGEAVRVRACVVAVYSVWEQLEDHQRDPAIIAGLRRRGQLLLSSYLSSHRARAFTYDLSESLAERVSSLALVHALWRVANALDNLEETGVA